MKTSVRVRPRRRVHWRKRVAFVVAATLCMAYVAAYSYRSGMDSGPSPPAVSKADEPQVPPVTQPVVSREKPPEVPPWKITTLATGLCSPDGLAIDPHTRDVYVSEEDAGRITRIAADGARSIVVDHHTSIYQQGSGTNRTRVPELKSPEGLAVDKNGTLYVVEDSPGGRLISFQLNPLQDGEPLTGHVIRIPGDHQDYAWESVDANDSGELILAGSTLEALAAKPGHGNLFQGAILHRDAGGRWWMPLQDTMTSYSAASFSPDGHYAFFASELLGEVGCLNMKSRHVQTFFMDKVFHSPEGLTALPDGTALVAEESGKIYRIDPVHDRATLIYDAGTAIESVRWDDAQKRLFITGDQAGALLSLQANLYFYSALEVIPEIPFSPERLPALTIPACCPHYLKGVLRLGGYDPDKDTEVSFAEFARRVNLVAVDARTRLVSHNQTVSDPIAQIQFVVFDPYLFGVDMGMFMGPVSGFVAVNQSGQILKTQRVAKNMLQVDLWSGCIYALGSQKVSLPYPLGAHLANDNIASIHFMGFGSTPDYHIILNAMNPRESYMMVTELNGSEQEYDIDLMPGADSGQWVIALKYEESEAWVPLGAGY